jgi:hypothetical protein
MHSIKHFSFLFSVFLISTLLSACGSKGDLYQVVEPEPEQKEVIKTLKQKHNNTQKKSK